MCSFTLDIVHPTNTLPPTLSKKGYPLSFFPIYPYILGRFTVMNVSNQTRGPKNGNETDFYYALR